jgi:hypothetical protein
VRLTFHDVGPWSKGLDNGSADAKEFAGPSGQNHWNDDFAKEMIRLALLGVSNINSLTECTKVLPPSTSRSFKASDQATVDLWANGGFQPKGQQFGQMLEDGASVDNGILASSGTDPGMASTELGTTPV